MFVPLYRDLKKLLTKHAKTGNKEATNSFNELVKKMQVRRAGTASQ